MGKVVTILLSFILLFQSVHLDYEDVVKFDEFIEHAQFHQAEYGDGFVVFLSKHYGSLKKEHSQKHQEEQKDHDKLPFQCQNHTAVLTVFVVQDVFFEWNAVQLSELKSTNFHYQSSFSSLHKKGLLQPPKHA